MASPYTPKKRPSPKSPKPSLSRRDFPLEPSLSFFPSSKPDLLQLVVVVAIAAAVAASCNFIVTYFNQQPKPFCDSNADSDFFLSDECEPCPSNGVCHEGKLECLSGYRNHGKLCVEDGEVNEAAIKLSKLMEISLCEAYAQYLCSGTGRIWASEDEVWNRLDEYKMEKYRMDEGAYIYAKHRAMDTIGRTMEFKVDDRRDKVFKCPELLVQHYVPLTCRIRQWIVEHALTLVPVCALFMGCILILHKVRRRWYMAVRSEELYNKVCDILEENALISRSINGEGEPWVVASWLRDHLLSPKERKDPMLWKKVEELVQEDSRLDRYPRMVKGESKIVWEWQVEGHLSSSGKRKKKTNESISVGTKLSPCQQNGEVKAGKVVHCQ